MATIVQMGAFSSVRNRLNLHGLWNWLVFTIVAILVLLPLTFLVLGSFSTAVMPTDFISSKLGLSNYAQVWSDPDILSVVGNTLITQWLAGQSRLTVLEEMQATRGAMA